MENKAIELDDFEIVCRICLGKKENMNSIFETTLLSNLIKTYKELLEECASVHVNESVKTSNTESHENDSKDAKTIKKYKCDDCERNFQLKIEFYKHQKRVHQKGYKCIFCGKIFNNLKSLWAHSPETVHCKICKQDYGCKTKLKRHVEEDHSTCDICGKTFQNSTQCKVHRMIHEDKRHLCTYCGKTFADNRSLRIHVRRHTGEKSYQCSQCDAKFCDAGGLRMHSVKHSDEKKHECDICKKPFKTKNSVIRHKRSHTEENKYLCDICNKQFKTHDYLRDHKKIHTGAFNHICTYCNKGFYKSHKLKIHLLTHTGEKPFACTKCGKISNLMKTYKEMLEECASVHISANDLLPKNICVECTNYLEQSYKFKIQYLSTEKLLEDIIANTQIITKVEYSNDDESHDFINDDNCFNSTSHFLLNENDKVENSSQNKVITKELISVKDELVKESNTESLENNTKDYNTIQKYKCDDCGIDFQLKIEFYKHRKLVHPRDYKCVFCDKMFKRSRDLWAHLPEVAQCKMCKQDYGCKTKLRNHVEKEHSTCEICGKVFQNRRQYHKHSATHKNRRLLCTYCGKEFARKPNYIVHVRRHTGEKPYKCTHCDAKFCDSKGLNIHSMKHTDERKFECDICKTTFKTKDSVRIHKRTHIDEKNYPCDICKKQFKTQNILHYHKKIHTGELNHICTYCNKGFYKSHKLKMHLRTHTGEKPFRCDTCGKMFSQKFQLNDNNQNEISQDKVSTTEFISVKTELVKESNSDLYENDSKDCNTIQKYKCDDCGIDFRLKVELYDHQNFVHLKGYKCMFCGKTFKRSYDLLRHSPIEPVFCYTCNQDYGCKNMFRDHVPFCKTHLTTHELKSFLCTYCGLTISKKSNYNAHIRRHTGEKSHQCPNCDKKFFDSQSLRKHSSSHSEERKFECDICKKLFKTKDSLKKHKDSHAEEEKYSCNVCNKRFRTMKSLRAHRIVHTGERKFVCSYCNKAFMKSDNLKMHLRTHTGEKPYSCEKCGKSYSQNHALKSHMKTHLENFLNNSTTQ
ncbi:zinc finger protein 91-like [Chrysoperla carnea]|uniref:zinc finger protein 91-like n=1 Tax=Chrysoperla carnea TaxID=189513 RepID=UPI001D0623E4|nr:zinc finger protein 91-like [Chrysoperla carnea]